MSSTEKNNLLACPCCGGEASIDDSDIGCVINCFNCGIGLTENNNTKRHAMEIWNTRADGWISVDDRLPDRDIYCLCYFSENDLEVLRYSGEYWTRKAWPIGCQPSHWMPLPDPPQA